MGPPENRTRPRKWQAAGRRKRPARPRMRRCLLKGCEQRYLPRRAGQRYWQRGVSEGGAEVVTMEGPAEVPENGRRQGEAQPPKPVLPGTGKESETSRSRAS